MSLDRRKPFARLQPNESKPSEALPTPATATARLTISRPRRQMPAYHYQHQQQYPQQKRYATMIPGSSRSSATSSAESLYSTTATGSSLPRRRKLSAAEDVAARVRARWAALEALERAGASSSRSGGAPASASTSYLHSTSAPSQRRRSPSANDAEKENAALLPIPIPMQVDAAYEKPLPPHPPALAPLHISAPVPVPATAAAYSASADGHTVVATMMDTRLDDCAPMSAPTTAAMAGPGPVPGPGESTVRTTPTSLTFVETDSASPGSGPALQRRPTRAVTPPQVRRRASITDELEEAVSSLARARTQIYILTLFVERRSDSDDVA